MFDFLKPSSLRRDARPLTDDRTLNTRLVIELTATVAQLRLELDGVTKRVEGLDRRRARTTMPGDRAFRLAEVSAIAGRGRRRGDTTPE
jgi:cell division septal protein FtsQ